MEVFCLCRAGFEKEVAAELQSLATSIDVAGYVKAKDNAAHVRFICVNSEGAEKLLNIIPFGELTYIRHWFLVCGEYSQMNLEDRVSPLRDAMSKVAPCGQAVLLELDTNEGKSLAKLTKGVSRHLVRELKQQQHWDIQRNDWVLHLIFLAGDHAIVGRAKHVYNSQWPGGIVRLKVPRSAPSRATLKLEEAWHHFIPKEEWESRLAPGMRGVDLGAAPGGWTWQLMNKSMFVDAVDNGPMDESIMESGQVNHHRVDGFSYEPAKPVDWLVCDIADKPMRVAHLIAKWGENRWCREAVFNLKLPMKQRFHAVQEATRIIKDRLYAADLAFELRFKQLYHDREEVTGHLRLMV